MPVRCSVSEFSDILQSKVSAAITHMRLSEGICRHFYVLKLTGKVPSSSYVITAASWGACGMQLFCFLHTAPHRPRRWPRCSLAVTFG